MEITDLILLVVITAAIVLYFLTREKAGDMQVSNKSGTRTLYPNSDDDDRDVNYPENFPF